MATKIGEVRKLLTSGSRADAKTCLSLLKAEVKLSSSDIAEIVKLVPDCYRRGLINEETSVSIAMWLANQTAFEVGFRLLELLSDLSNPLAMFEIARIGIAKVSAGVDAKAMKELILEVTEHPLANDDLQSRALNLAARCYKEGIGCVQDLNPCFELHLRAAKLGNVESMYEAAIFYLGEYGKWDGRVNYEKSAVLLQEAMQRGKLEARTKLAELHCFGLIQEADHNLGIELLKNSVQDGDPKAGAILVRVQRIVAGIQKESRTVSARTIRSAAATGSF